MGGGRQKDKHVVKQGEGGGEGWGGRRKSRKTRLKKTDEKKRWWLGGGGKWSKNRRPKSTLGERRPLGPWGARSSTEKVEGMSETGRKGARG